MECQPFEFASFLKNFRSPTVRLRRRFDLAQHGAGINRLAVIATVIFAELLHVENFTQSRTNAKNFYPFNRATPATILLCYARI